MINRPNDNPRRPSAAPNPAYLRPSPPLAAARRAATLQFVTGGLGLVCGTCLASSAFLLPIERMIAEGGMVVPTRDGMTPTELVKAAFLTAGVLFSLGSILLIALAFVVRTGSRGGAIASGIAVGLALIFMVVNVVMSLGNLASRPSETGLGIAIACVPISLFAILIYLLIDMLRGRSQLEGPVVVDPSQWEAWQRSQQQTQSAGKWSYEPQIPASPKQHLTPPPLPPTGAKE